MFTRFKKNIKFSFDRKLSRNVPEKWVPEKNTMPPQEQIII